VVGGWLGTGGGRALFTGGEGKLDSPQHTSFASPHSLSSTPAHSTPASIAETGIATCSPKCRHRHLVLNRCGKLRLVRGPSPRTRKRRSHYRATVAKPLCRRQQRRRDCQRSCRRIQFGGGRREGRSSDSPQTVRALSLLQGNQKGRPRGCTNGGGQQEGSLDPEFACSRAGACNLACHMAPSRLLECRPFRGILAFNLMIM